MSHTFQINKDHLESELKRLGYMLFLLPALLPPMAWLLWQLASQTSWAARPAHKCQHIRIPTSAGFIRINSSGGRTHRQRLQQSRNESDVAALGAQRYYRVLVYLTLPLSVISLVGGMYLFTQWSGLTAVGKLGLIASFGVIHAGIMINAGHELIHKPTRHEQRIGGILLSLALYPSFKIEHVRGHHIHVATPADHSTSRLGQTLYSFLGNALYNNVRTAWRLEADLLNKRGKPVFSLHNELIRWYMLVLLVALASFTAFGLAGLGFLLLRGLSRLQYLKP